MLRALDGGASVSSADMRALARRPLAIVAAIGAQEQVPATAAAAFWLLAQTEAGTLEPDDSWAWRPAREIERPLVLRVEVEVDDD